MTDVSSTPWQGQPHAIVERDGVRYTLLGTAHVSRASVDAVRAAIATGAYDTVAVELDEQRLQAMTDPEALGRMDLVKVLREGKTPLFAANLALALAAEGARVGVLDADIYGPSIPSMLGVAGQQPQLEHEQFVPIAAQGMPMLSIGSLLSDDTTPIAWRGAKATGALMQLYNQTNWPNLDYLVIDMPPGTGDIQLTLAQRIPVTGAVIVTTPQHIALLDAQKGIEMFRKTHIPVLGVVENMALHTCSSCGHTEAIFGEGGGDKMAAQYQVPLLGQLPLAKGIREQADKGEPSVIANQGAGDEFADYYLNIAKNIEANIAKFAKPHDNNRIF